MRRSWAFLLLLVAGCAFDDGFEDRYSGGYVMPPGAPAQYQAPNVPVYQPGSSCANRAGVVPAAYSPPPASTEPPR